MAFLSTFLYGHLMLTDAINMRISAYDTLKRNEEWDKVISLIKYCLLMLMAVFWGIITKQLI